MPPESYSKYGTEGRYDLKGTTREGVTKGPEKREVRGREEGFNGPEKRGLRGN